MGLVAGIDELAVHVAILVEGAEDVILGHVQSDKLHIGVEVLGLDDGAGKRVTGHHDDVVALRDGLVDHLDAGSGGVVGGLVVLEVNCVLLAEGLASLIGGLVKGLVGDVAVVGDHRNLDVAGSLNGSRSFFGACGSSLFLAAAGSQSKDHHQRQKQSNVLFHA